MGEAPKVFGIKKADGDLWSILDSESFDCLEPASKMTCQYLLRQDKQKKEYVQLFSQKLFLHRHRLLC